MEINKKVQKERGRELIINFIKQVIEFLMGTYERST